jgi:hypothetical protein
LAQLTISSFQLCDPRGARARDPRPIPFVDVGLFNPQPKRLVTNS